MDKEIRKGHVINEIFYVIYKGNQKLVTDFLTEMNINFEVIGIGIIIYNNLNKYLLREGEQLTVIRHIETCFIMINDKA